MVARLVRDPFDRSKFTVQAMRFRGVLAWPWDFVISCGLKRLGEAS